MKALIAGAGIAGLATGTALRRAGLDVEIFERSPALTEVGAGLMIWPNGSRSLESLEVTVDSLAVSRLSVCTWQGRRLNVYPLDAITARHGVAPSFVHRAELQSKLSARFGASGLHLGAEVIEYREHSDRVELILRTGEVVQGDLLIGADGLRSAVRRQLLGDGDPSYLGSTIWRGTVRDSEPGLETGSGANWIGRGSEFLAFHLPGGEIYWAGVTKEPPGEVVGSGGHKRDLLRRFGHWTHPIPHLIAATEDAAILRNDMYDRKPARRWSEARATLVGDAAHPMTPNAGQGACQALEDAITLGESIRRAPNLGAAIATYEKRRMRRANRVVTMSRQATRAVQLDNPLLCALRDGVSRVLAERVFLRTLDGVLAPEPD